MARSRFRQSLLAALCLLATAVGLLTINSERTPRFKGFSNAHWQSSTHCKAIVGESFDFALNNFLLVEPSTGDTVCKSDWLTPAGEILQLEYSALFYGVESHQLLSIEVIDKRGISRGSTVVPKYSFDQQWRTHSWDIADSEKIQIIVRNSTKARSQVRIRSRVNFYTFSPLTLDSVRNLGAIPVLVISAMLLLIVFKTSFWQNFRSSRSTFILLFLISAVVHFRSDVYFHFDEWFFLGRLFESGNKALFISHNEHVIPAFSLLYLLEYTLFGRHYWAWTLVSLALHTGNALLLAKLVTQLSSRYSEKRLIGLVVAFFYLISSLHGAVLQWSLCQSSLLAIFFFLIAANTSCHYWRSGDNKALLLIAACWLLALLSFGVLFSGIILLPLLSAFYLSMSSVQRDAKASWRLYGLSIGIPALLAAGLYYALRHGSGLSVDQRPDFDLGKLFAYGVTGTQFGTIARGIGVVPMPDLLSISEFYAVTLGVVCNLLFLFHAIASKQRKERVSNWLLAQAFIWIPLFLIGVGRLRWGTEHAISLRYQALPAVGLCILVCPLAQDVVTHLKTRSLCWTHYLATAAFTALILTQLYAGWRFQHFRHSGALMQNYVSQLDHWGAALEQRSLDPTVAEHRRAKGTDIAGMHPIAVYGKPDPVLRIPELDPSSITAVLGLRSKPSSSSHKLKSGSHPH